MNLSPDGLVLFDPIDTSSSELRKIDRCAVAWYIKYVLRLRPRTTKPVFITGGITHEALAMYYEPTTDPEDRDWELLEELLRDAYKERLTIDLVDPEQKTWALLWSMLSAYWKCYEGKDWILADTEIEFRVPIFLEDRLVGFVHGRFDGLLIEEKGIWIVDHKTTKRFRLKHLGIDPQMNVYCLAGSKLFGKRFQGLILNYLRTKPSAKSPNFLRVRTVRTRRELYTIEQDVGTRLLQMGSMTPRDLNFSCRRDCTWDCDYRHLCSALRQGIPVEGMISSGFRVRPFATEGGYE